MLRVIFLPLIAIIAQVLIAAPLTNSAFESTLYLAKDELLLGIANKEHRIYNSLASNSLGGLHFSNARNYFIRAGTLLTNELTLRFDKAKWLSQYGWFLYKTRHDKERTNALSMLLESQELNENDSTLHCKIGIVKLSIFDSTNSRDVLLSAKEHFEKALSLDQTYYTAYLGMYRASLLLNDKPFVTKRYLFTFLEHINKADKEIFLYSTDELNDLKKTHGIP